MLERDNIIINLIELVKCTPELITIINQYNSLLLAHELHIVFKLSFHFLTSSPKFTFQLTLFKTWTSVAIDLSHLVVVLKKIRKLLKLFALIQFENSTTIELSFVNVN